MKVEPANVQTYFILELFDIIALLNSKKMNWLDNK